MDSSVTRSARIVAVAIIVLITAVPQTQARAKGVDMNPPSGIVQTTATLEQVLTAHDKAVGKSTVPTNAALIEDGTISMSGLSGTYHSIDYRDDYVNTTTLGPFVRRDGVFNGDVWSQDENGQVSHVEGIHERAMIDAYTLDNALSGGDSDVKLLGEVSKPVSAYVVEVNPADGRREWIFFDKTTNLIDRTEMPQPTGRFVETYANFQTRNGLTEAWSSHFSDGHNENDEDDTITSITTSTNIDPSDIETPTSRALVRFPGGETSVDLPVLIDKGRIILQTVVNGVRYDFQLDSGSSTIVVDNNAAKQMGLQLYGRRQQTAAGRFTASQAVIPELDVGELTMSNVAVDVFPFKDKTSSGDAIVGLIGFDFIAGLELQVDYGHKTVTALLPGMYQPPSDAYVIPAALDDQVPVIAVQVGQTIGEHFILDTGASDGFLFPDFVANHKQDVADRGLGSVVDFYYPHEYAEGVGGYIKLKPTQVAAFTVGGITFKDWLVNVLVNDYAQEEEDYDGLVGYDFLRYFTVVFDYADSQIYLEPSDAARKRKMSQL